MFINSYAGLQSYLNAFLRDIGRSADDAPHGAFWNTMSYQDFITKDVPRFRGVKILVKGEGELSNIVHALLGTGRFAPDGDYPRMPPGGPYMDRSGATPIIDWINRGCPQFATGSEGGGESVDSSSGAE